jgi:hypothetical protein
MKLGVFRWYMVAYTINNSSNIVKCKVAKLYNQCNNYMKNNRGKGLKIMYYTSRSWLLGNTSHSLRDADGFTSGSSLGCSTGSSTWWWLTKEATPYGVFDMSRNYTTKEKKSGSYRKIIPKTKRCINLTYMGMSNSPDAFRKQSYCSGSSYQHH